MLAKKSRPVIGILTGSSITGDRFHFDHQITRSPKSPKKNFDLGGVGLGIVAALQSSADDRTDYPPNRSLISRSSNRSKPIPVSPPPNPRGGDRLFEEEMASESSEEEYTIVTRHSQNKSRSEVYGRGGRCDGERSLRTENGGVFHLSPVSYGCGGVPAADFLSSCHLCRKKLQGEDIYMYRGEKAFCSEECRYREIVMDERADKCMSKAATRTVDLSGAAYVNGQIFTTGILAI